MLADAGSGALGAATSYMRGDIGGVLKSVMSVGKRVMNGDKAHNVTLQTRSSDADVISWSGCKDSQTSADTSMQGQATGAMSWAFITRCAGAFFFFFRLWLAHPRLTVPNPVVSQPDQVPSANLPVSSPFGLRLVSRQQLSSHTPPVFTPHSQLLNTIRDELRGKFGQKPQLAW